MTKSHNNFPRILMSIMSIIASLFFFWNVTAYQDEDYYKLISPLHVTTIIFYFNIFLINIKFKNKKLSKLFNI